LSPSPPSLPPSLPPARVPVYFRRPIRRGGGGARANFALRRGATSRARKRAEETRKLTGDFKRRASHCPRQIPPRESRAPVGRGDGGGVEGEESWLLARTTRRGDSPYSRYASRIRAPYALGTARARGAARRGARGEAGGTPVDSRGNRFLRVSERVILLRAPSPSSSPALPFWLFTQQPERQRDRERGREREGEGEREEEEEEKASATTHDKLLGRSARRLNRRSVQTGRIDAT